MKIMLSDHTKAVDKEIKTPLNGTLLVKSLELALSGLTSQIPTIISIVSSKRREVKRSLKNKTAKKVVNIGYTLTMGTVLETPINSKLSMNMVSPKHKPKTPLRIARINESPRKVTKFHSFPDAPK